MSRPTIAEIDLDAIAFNFLQVRKLVGRNAKICPAVKADAYGHGAVEASRALLDAGAEMLGVATVEEGLELRQARIHAPILLLGCILPDQIPEAIRCELTMAVCDHSSAAGISREAQAADRRVKVHIKVDTGMGRIGAQPEEAVDLTLGISKMPGLEIEGIFTHFPCANEEDLSFTHQQIREFQQIIQAIEDAGLHIPLRHAANSGAILNVPESYFDMVRPGIMLYGLYDSTHRIELRQSMTLKSKIAFIKELAAGKTVSYGRTFTAARRTLVATVPIGYADGYNRLLSNKAAALVHGKRVPVIGRVCMDQTMLDVTEVSSVSVGDEVVLYGRQGDECIRIEEIAALLGTISYEVVCAVGKRVPRVYLRKAPR
ncbi:MAG TPA: alanine racemase [Armatimonadota bacterium]|nr:alanine racemase [Armatimonadota bacterium]